MSFEAAPLPSSDLAPVLAALFPPEGIVYVGPATLFEKSFVGRLKAKDRVVIDSDPARVAIWAERAKEIGAQLIDAVLAERPGTRTYYSASLSQESGLINPQHLTDLWQNIISDESYSVDTKPLSSLLSTLNTRTNWLEIRPLNAKEILRGLEAEIEGFDVIIARCVASNAESSDLTSLERAGIDSLLTDQGFSPLLSLSDRHPKLQTVIYVRDYKQALHQVSSEMSDQIETLQASRKDQDAQYESTLSELKAGFETKLAEANAEKNALMASLGQLQTEFESVCEQKTALIGQLDTKAALLDEKSKEAGTLGLKNAELETKLQEASTESNELQAHLEQLEAQLSSTSSELSQRIKDVDRLKLELTRAGAERDELSVRIEALSDAEQEAERAIKLQKLSENNLKDLQAKYRALAEVNQEQSKRLKEIRTHLETVLNEAPSETSLPQKTRQPKPRPGPKSRKQDT